MPSRTWFLSLFPLLFFQSPLANVFLLWCDQKKKKKFPSSLSHTQITVSRRGESTDQLPANFSSYLLAQIRSWSFPKPLEKALTDWLRLFSEPRDKEDVISLLGLKKLEPTPSIVGLIPPLTTRLLQKWE